jgi:hypothetical protein
MNIMTTDKKIQYSECLNIITELLAVICLKSENLNDEKCEKSFFNMIFAVYNEVRDFTSTATNFDSENLKINFNSAHKSTCIDMLLEISRMLTLQMTKEGQFEELLKYRPLAEDDLNKLLNGLNSLNTDKIPAPEDYMRRIAFIKTLSSLCIALNGLNNPDYSFWDNIIKKINRSYNPKALDTLKQSDDLNEKFIAQEQVKYEIIFGIRQLIKVIEINSIA